MDTEMIGLNAHTHQLIKANSNKNRNKATIIINY